MATLLLRFHGPMQSWGTTSRFDERDTQLEPSKSGVLGLVCAALGRDRAEPIEDLAALRMGVRVDREGVLMRDYHTATGVMLATGKAKRDRTVLSRRYYLADAVFLVGLEGDLDLLVSIQGALGKPVWPLSLGRKSFAPSSPVWLSGGLVDKPLAQALGDFPSLVEMSPRPDSRGVMEDPKEGSVRFDQPLGSFASRAYGPRLVKPILFPGEADAPR